MGENNSNSVFNFGDLSKPATVLIEKVSEAIGGLAGPWQIRRMAQANADATTVLGKAECESEIARAKARSEVELIDFEAELTKKDIELRAITRFIAEESQKQRNIENITQKAISCLAADAKPQNIEMDWLVNFFDKSRLISDDEMQALWAKILAGEANQAGSYSKRTVNLCESIDKYDAQLFTLLCRFRVDFGARVYIPLVFSNTDPIYKNLGLYYANLVHLDSIGLINFSGLEQRILGGDRDKVVITYFDESRTILFSNSNRQINIGNTVFTKAGEELCTLIDGEPVEGFFDYIQEKLTNG